MVRRMAPRENRYHHAVAALLVGLLLVTAGCGSFSGPNEETSTPAPTETPAPVPTDSASPTPTDEGTAGNTTTEATDAVSGQMRVVVAGDELEAAGEGSESLGFQFADNGSYVYTAEGDDVTVAEALSTLDVNATNESLTYENETYRESTENVTLSYRVDGEPVDPTERTLGDGDEVWVFVRTPETNLSVPGEHIPHERLHVHGEIEFVVNGSEVDFSREKYQQSSHQRHFHFENGEADPWHAHSWAVTLGYAMDTLEGIDVSNDSVTYNGTTYDESDPGVDVTVRVNGEPVAPEEYVLKDGDSIRVVVEAEAEG